MKSILIFFGLLFISDFALAQLEIKNRVIFIGDAGEINFKQETIIDHAAALILKDKTTVIYLGDNIYPKGIGLTGSEEEESTKNTLRSQYKPMRAKEAPVYFIPGNHDWDKMGKEGLAKIKAQSNFLNGQQDSLLKLVPANACPGPVEIQISDQMVVIAMDSEWWLFPHEKKSPESDCECNSKTEVLEKLEEILYKNRKKTILLSTHHPFQSYGVHGGYYSWKDHVFPLTTLHKKLFMPLPVIGSLYPLLRSTVFLNPEDIPHPQYKELIKEVTETFEGFPNVIYVSGHEHGLQLIKNKDTHQIISGSGAKATYIKKGDNLIYGSPNQGFVTVDLLSDRSTNINYYTYESGKITKTFNYSIPYHEISVSDKSTGSTDLKADSIIIRANPSYNEVGHFHRKLFGENYREEWAAETKVPLISVSEFGGGLSPLKRGGGMQTTSLRLVDKTGKEWTLRKVNKNSEMLLPPGLQNTFVRNFIDDAVSAQHPYSALMVPPIANAVKVPASEPIIGIVKPDTALGPFNSLFANTLNLLEAREPLGGSDNTLKMLEKVYDDNDNTFGAKTFIRSRMLDLLIGDWDRHEDQYRWYNSGSKKNKDYQVVPRDRDQVIRVMQGLIPRTVSRAWAVPTIQGFGPEINNVNYSLFKSDFLNSHPKMQFNYKDWMDLSHEFVKLVSDSVLEESLSRLPRSSYQIRHDQLLKDLRQRRDAIPDAMDKHYRFINSIVDIRVSNKNEKISILDAAENSVRIVINKINKDGETKGLLMDKLYSPEFTKEIRIYLSEGDDSVKINTKNSDIKLRVIGEKGRKNYLVEEAGKKIKIYDSGINSTYAGDTLKLRKFISADTTNTAFVPVNLYNVTMPLVTAGYNIDDGLLLGAGFKYTHQEGFRKTPFNHTQQLLVSGSLATGSYKINYKGHWKALAGKADFLIDADTYAPNNTQNFFGLGNESEYDNNREIKYYRTRFNLSELSPSLQWNTPKSTFQIGPALQYYNFNPDKNTGRFINEISKINSYDSLTISKEKLFGGLKANFIKDNRNSKLFPSNGGYFNMNMKAYTGLNRYAESFIQLSSEIALYRNFVRGSIIIANRTGGGVTIGKTAFYQSLFLGGNDNLRGTHKYRYAGEQLFYNNFETRIRLLQLGSYFLPGQLGLIGFYDIGKTWSKGYHSDIIHQGYGGGVYYAPAMMTVIQIVAGHSNEGWYPHFSLGFRF